MTFAGCLTGKDWENRETENSHATRLRPPLHRVLLTRYAFTRCSQHAGPTPSGQAHGPSPLWRIVVGCGGVILWVDGINLSTFRKVE
jgi:hypothetical protein